jgi:hypothetical protein
MTKREIGDGWLKYGDLLHARALAMKKAGQLEVALSFIGAASDAAKIAQWYFDGTEPKLWGDGSEPYDKVKKS